MALAAKGGGEWHHCELRHVFRPCVSAEVIQTRSKKNMTLSIELRNMDNTEPGTNSVEDIANVKVKEIVIVSLILSVWFYSLYRYI